jgi:uncharacterized protein (TIGR04141 family)
MESLKNGHYNVALLRSNIQHPKQALADKKIGTLRPMTLKFKDPKAWIYVKESEKAPSAWQKMIASYVVEEISLEDSINRSALIFVEIENRIFVILFGSAARHCLKANAIELDFGYEVANKVIDPKSINNIEFNSYESNSIKSKLQTTEGKTIGSFGLNPFQDNLKLLSGKTKNSIYGKRLYGAKSLVLSQSLELPEVFEICKSWLAIYKEKKNVDSIWRNYAKKVTELATINKLEDQLIQSLKMTELDKLVIGPPEQIDFMKIEGFKYSFFENSITTELSLPLLLQNMNPKHISKDILNKCYVMEKNAESGEIFNKWTVWECLEFEISIGGSTFYLQNGEWVEFEKKIVGEVNKMINEIENSQLLFPIANKTESEFQYNSRVCKEIKGLMLLDQDLLRCDGYESGIEFCDILDFESGEFIHLKKGTRSSGISHLVRQGVNSIKLLLSEESFKGQAKKQFFSDKNETEIQSFFQRPDLTVTLGVITSKRGKWSDILPFFSQLTIIEAYKDLKLSRINFKLAKIEEKDNRVVLRKQRARDLE